MNSPAAIGASSLGLSTTVFPAASGAATARALRMTGAFHGANAATTPSGSRIASDSWPGTSVVSTSPMGWVTAAAASRRMLAASMTLNPAHPPTPPTSAAMIATTSAVLVSSSSAARSRIPRFTDGVVADHSGKAT